jgi:acyl-CoA thioester hydrolase
MASLKIDYLAQLKHPSSLVIGQRVSRVGSTSFDIESVIFGEDEKPVCIGLVVAVCFDFGNQKPVEVYDSIKDDFNG